MAWKMVEYLCKRCGRFERLESTTLTAGDCEPERCHCGGMVERVISAPKIRELTGPGSVSVTRGKPEEPPPGCVSTRPDRWK